MDFNQSDNKECTHFLKKQRLFAFNWKRCVDWGVFRSINSNATESMFQRVERENVPIEVSHSNDRIGNVGKSQSIYMYVYNVYLLFSIYKIIILFNHQRKSLTLAYGMCHNVSGECEYFKSTFYRNINAFNAHDDALRVSVCVC